MSRTLAYLFAMSWGAALALAAAIAFRSVRWKELAARGLESSRCRETVLALFWMFCGGMAVITLTPRWVIWSLIDLVNHGIWNAAGDPFFSWGTMNWLPFRTFAADAHSRYILLGNVVMFLPFGFFAGLLWRGFSVKRALLLGICTAGGIECWQLLIGRAFDVDDLMLNTLGVLTGYLLWNRIDRSLLGRLRLWVRIDAR